LLVFLQITIQYAGAEGYPVVAELHRGAQPVVRSEGRLQLDEDALMDLAVCTTASEYGLALGRALFGQTLREAFIRARASSPDQLRVLLGIEPAELRVLHWERLHAPLEGERWDYLALDQRSLLSLYTPSAAEREFPTLYAPELRALVVVAAPTGLADFGLASFDEARAAAAAVTGLGSTPSQVLAQTAVGMGERWLGSPTLDMLCEQLSGQRYSILHLVCHGQARPDGETVLYLADARGRVQPVTGTLLLERLGRLRSATGLPYFIFLSTCETAHAAAERGLGGLAQRLVRELGVPAVLAMSGKVALDLALDLARRFYPRLLAHGEPDRALAEVNAVLIGHVDGLIPVLYSRLRAQPLFEQCAGPSEFLPADLERVMSRLAELLPGHAPGALADLEELSLALRSSGAPGQTSAAETRKRVQAQLSALCEETLEVPIGALARESAGVTALATVALCPFPGLNAFQPTDGAYFFGRERMIERMVERLRTHSFLAVLGPSGSGKSSVILAGVVPALRRHNPSLRVVRCSPGRNPQERLQQALTELVLTTGAPSDLLIIDGFEECFTLCPDPARCAAFIADLLTLRGSVFLVLTLRADYWGDCAIAPALQEAITAHHELVAPLSPAELAQAIERQAVASGLRLAPDLLAALLHDLQAEPGAMPLLQHALRELWRQRRGRQLWARDYRRIGGVRLALAETADGIYAAASAPDQERLREVFTRLIQLDGDAAPGEPRRDTRRRVELVELIPDGDSREPMRRLLAALADARLVVLRCDGPGGEQTVEVAHESLIRHWPQLRRWLDEDRIALGFREGVRQAARAWQAEASAAHLLVHRGERLALVQKLQTRPRCAFNQLERAYLDACTRLQDEQLEREQTSARQLAAALGNALTAARRAESRQLAMSAGNVRETQPLLALLLARAAVEREPTCEAVSQLYGALLPSFALVTLGPHPDAVTGACFSPDGGLVLTMSVDKIARLWSVQGGLLATLRSHEEALTAVSFSPSGALLLTASRDGTARLWTQQGVQVANLGGHQGPVLGARFSPDGTLVLTLGVDGTARLFDVTGQTEARSLGHTQAVLDGQFSPDSQYLVTVAHDGTAQVWDRRGVLGARWSAHTAPVTSVGFSPDGEHILTASWDTTARLWDREGRPGAVLRGHESRLLTATFSPDGQRLLTASRDRTARLWRPTGEPLAVLRGHESGLLGASFSPDGATVLTVASDAHAVLWDDHGQIIGTLRGHRRPLTCGSLSPDGATVLTGSWDGTARLWPSCGATLPVLRGHQSAVVHGAFDPAGTRLATAGQDGRIALWSQRGRLRRLFTGHTDEITACQFSPDGEQILTASRDHCGCLWSVDGQAPVWLRGHTGWLTSATFSPDGRLILTTALDQTARLWRRDGRLLAVLGGHTGAVHAGCFSPDGTTLLTAGADSTARRFGLDGTPQVTLRGHSDCVVAVTVSPDGELVLTCSWDGSARLWQRDGTVHAVLSGHGSWVLGGSFSPDGALVLTYGRDAVARLWARSGQGVAILRGHRGAITGGSFSPDGACVLTVSQDGTGRLWSRAGHRLAVLTAHQDAVLGGCFSRDGAWLMTAGADELARIWPANLTALRGLSDALAVRDFTHEERDEYLCPDEPMRAA
jgi:WD40 repeat protein